VTQDTGVIPCGPHSKRAAPIYEYIETRYTARLLESGTGGVGYLLKDRLGNVADFLSAPGRVAAGGTALDPEVISQLLRKPDPGLASLTPQERRVLGLMAEGRSNSGIAGKLALSESAVEKPYRQHLRQAFP
jgi:DNA-binding NarL/FixJ family response regulator